MSKTGAGLAKWAQDIHDGGKHVYWYGTYCNACTASRLAGKTRQYPTHYKSSRQATYKKHIAQGKICTDCAGLIKGYYWEQNGVVKYKRNGLPDKGSNAMYNAATVKGLISDGMPEIPGLLVWADGKGHVGVYVGGGQVVEARGFEYGIQKNALASRSFKYWGLCPYIKYTAQEIATAKSAMDGKTTAATSSTSNTSKVTITKADTTMPTIRKGSQGTAVKVLQRMLMAAGCTLPRYGADGDCGSETVEAVKAFQTTHNMTVDGICGPLTWAALAAG